MVKTWWYHGRPIFWNGGCYKSIIDLKIVFVFILIFLIGIVFGRIM